MKKHLIKPGFELVFALSIMAIIGLPPLVFAQNAKDVEIKISNGDTLVNGKNIKDLSPADRADALKDINNLDNISSGNKALGQHFMFGKHSRGDSTFNREFAIRGDSSGRMMRFKFRHPGGKDSSFAFNYRMNPGESRFESRDFDSRNFNMDMRDRGLGMMRRRNTQNFSYSNTGSDGMTTHVNFAVSDVSPEKTKEVTGMDKADLVLTDLNLVPEFSTGKTLLMFTLPAHSTAEVKFMDHDGKVIWGEKALNGRFSKNFVLGLNGIYLLEVKQAGKVALKRVIKEE